MTIKPEDVPEEAWYAFKRFILERPYGYDYREAIVAALNAWEGKECIDWCGLDCIILPLPPAGEQK